MTDVLTMPWDDVLDDVEAHASAGNDRARRILDAMLEHEAAGGRLDSAVMRVAASRYVAVPPG